MFTLARPRRGPAPGCIGNGRGRVASPQEIGPVDRKPITDAFTSLSAARSAPGRTTPGPILRLLLVVNDRLIDAAFVKARAPARATKLVADLHAAAAALIKNLERIEPERWSQVPAPSVWSVGKDAAHVAEAAVYHQWIVRLTIGQKVSSRRPAIERTELITTMTAKEAVHLIRQHTEEGVALVSSLSDEELAYQRGLLGLGHRRSPTLSRRY